MQNETNQYIISKAIDVAVLDSNKVQLKNLLNRKKLDLNNSALNLIATFENRIFLKDDFIRSFPKELEPTAQEFFAFLSENQIIIPSDGHKSIHSFSAFNYGLFNAHNSTFDVSNKNIIVGIPFDKGNKNSLSIASAPSYLRNTCSSNYIDLKKTRNETLTATTFLSDYSFQPLLTAIETKQLVDVGDLYYYSYGNPQQYYTQIESITNLILENNNIPLFIGGDHSITLPILRGFAKHYDRFGVLHIDAHSDLYQHSLDAAFEDIATHHHGNFALKALPLDAIKTYHLIGIRGLNTITIPDNEKIKVNYCNEIINSDKWIDDVDCSMPYYITFDIDVLDYSIAPATCTAVPGGINYSRILDILSKLTKKINVIGADIVEIDPERDHQELTAQSALSVILVLLNSLCNKKKYEH